MTLRSHIFFKSALAPLLVLGVGVVQAATVTGQVALVAEHAEPHGNMPTTVVWLSTAVGNLPGHPTTHARMIQKDKRFEPHILPIEVGTLVDFPNLDPIFHNAFSNFDGQLFDIGLYPPHSSRSVRFRREGLVRVFCNIHPAMSAVIVVLATPYFTVTDKAGRYTIANVLPGEYKLHFFHERATPETLDALTRSVVVANGANNLGEITISEAGYIPLEHKNKYGLDYPPEKPAIYH